MILINERLHNCHYVNSFLFSPFNKGFWDSFQNQQISNNFIKKIQKQEKVIMKLLNIKRFYYGNYLTLKDLDQDQKNPVFEYLKKLVPSVFQDGILNFDLLKQHLNSNEKIIQNTRNFLGLDWATKEKAKLEYSKNVKNKTLLPDVNQSLNFDQAKNIIIEGDNLEALKILQSAYQEKVDVIYIDPPYNTGNDFVYNDNFKQGSYEYKLANGLIDEDGLKTTTNQKTNARIHSNWLDMIYPRLKVARNLLKEDGVIFISIDDHEHAHLKLICDEIFNEQNFISTLIWLRNPGGESDNSHIANTKDFILMYSKKIDKFKINELKKEKNILDFKVTGNEIWKKGSMLEKSGENDRLIDRHNLGYVVYYNEKTKEVLTANDYNKDLIDDKLTSDKIIYHFNQELLSNGFIPIIPRIIKNTYGCWRMGEKKFLELYSQNKILFEKQKDNSIKIFEKVQYVIEDPYLLQKPKDFISFTTNSKGTNEMTKLFSINPFTKPKPTDLITYLINLHTNPNALVLDFFAGSGTTAQAVMELNQEDGGNRKYILVQLPEPIENNPEFKTICDITRARITRSIEKYQYNDLGFKYFKIGKSNFPIWQVQTDDSDKIIESQLNVFESLNSNQNYESMLYELMIREGMRFDENIQLHQIHDYQFWADEFFNYLFFLEPTNPNNLFQVIKQIIENKEQEGKTRIYINEAYFDDLKGDEMKLNLAEQISQYKKEIQLVVV